MIIPTLHYFSICGRGELARLTAAAGGLQINDQAWSPAFDDSGGWRSGYGAIGEGMGFPPTMPILEMGDFKIFQSQAIESYIASIAPAFADLTPEQRARDLMFALIKADINQPTEQLLFKKITGDDLKPIMAKNYAMVESLLPAEGYVNGLEFPTMADLAVVVIAKGCMPFQVGRNFYNNNIIVPYLSNSTSLLYASELLTHKYPLPPCSPLCTGRSYDGRLCLRSSCVPQDGARRSGCYGVWPR